MKRLANEYYRFIALNFLLVSLAMPPALADAGIPMLGVMAVPMWLLLFAVVPLEAYCARRILSLPKSESMLLSMHANTVSSAVGVPLTYVVLCLGEFYLSQNPVVRAAAEGKAGFYLHFLLTAPWMVPLKSDLYWMIPVASAILLVPFFFASVLSEYWAAARLQKTADRKLLRKWAWVANGLSYALMLLIAAILLVVSVARHNAELVSDRHRDVDTVSAERLWENAVSDSKQFQPTFIKKVDHSPHQSTPDEDVMERAYWRAESERSSGHPAKAEKILRAALTHIESEQYLKTATRKQKDRDSLNIRDSLASLLVEQNRVDEAIPLYEQLLAEDDAEALENPTGYHSYSSSEKLLKAYEQTKQVEKEDKLYKHLIDADKKQAANRSESRDPKIVISYAQFCVRQKKISQADSLFQDALQITKTSRKYELSKVTLTYAKFLFEQKQYDRAIAILTDAIKAEQSEEQWTEFRDDSRIAEISLALGRCYIAVKNYPLAEHCVKVALRGKDLKGAAQVYAELCAARGDSAQAKVWSERAQHAEQTPYGSDD